MGPLAETTAAHTGLKGRGREGGRQRRREERWERIGEGGEGRGLDICTVAIAAD